MTDALSGRRAIIVGGSSGIGFGSALRLARAVDRSTELVAVEEQDRLDRPHPWHHDRDVEPPLVV